MFVASGDAPAAAARRGTAAAPQLPLAAAWAVGVAARPAAALGSGGCLANALPEHSACRAAALLAAAALLPRRAARRGLRRRGLPQRRPSILRAQALLDDLQGTWEDDVGNFIEISGDQADFSDGTGSWKIEDLGGELLLRGTRFTGTPERPSWRFPNGLTRRWLRKEPPTEEELAWAEAFYTYKQTRMQLRRQLWAAVAAEDFEPAAELQKAWASAGSPPEGLGLEAEAKLAAGRRLVPGVCFVHRRYGYRAVVVACEPCCNAPAAWRSAMGVASLTRGELQPFYHCLVDERDRPGGQSTFVGEENMKPASAAFPVQHPLVERLLVRCDELEGYLPKPELEEAIRQQQGGKRFAWDSFM